MATEDYFRILGLSKGCTLNDLKRAYRIKARLYHPDINPDPGASDKFVSVTEAYVYLLKYLTNLNATLRSGETGPDNWNNYQRQRARERAEFYARMKFDSFTRTSTYRTTRIFDGTTIIYGLIISVVIIGLDIYSFSMLKDQATTREDQPSLVFMLLILALGLGFFIFAYINLLSFIKSSRKRKHND